MELREPNYWTLQLNLKLFENFKTVFYVQTMAAKEPK